MGLTSWGAGKGGSFTGYLPQLSRKPDEILEGKKQNLGVREAVLVLVPAFFPGSRVPPSHHSSPNSTQGCPCCTVLPPSWLPTGQASAGGQGLEESKLSWEVVALGILTSPLHLAALGFLVLLGLLPAPASAQAHATLPRSSAWGGLPHLLSLLCPLSQPLGNIWARPRALLTPPNFLTPFTCFLPSLPLLLPPQLSSCPAHPSSSFSLFLVPSHSSVQVSAS